jgi:hypothetical protein
MFFKIVTEKLEKADSLFSRHPYETQHIAHYKNECNVYVVSGAFLHITTQQIKLGSIII